MSDDRERLRQLRLQARILQEEARLKVLQRHSKRLAESQESWEWIGGYQDVVDRLRGPERDLVLPVSTAADRRYGANWPFWRTWVEHSRLRASARLICTLSTLADGALQGLTSYVIGEGFTFRATSKDTAPDDLLAAVQDCVDDFDDANCFDELQQELFVRDRRDGEFFLRSFDDDYGTMLVRTVEPEQVLEPVGQDPEVHSFGIYNKREDLQQVTAYHVALDGNAGNGEEVPADEIVHSKVNVDRLVKRGLTDFCFDTYDQLKSASRLLENMTEGAAIQASIALLRQHEGTSSAGVSEFIGSIADYEQFNGVTGRTEKVERFYPGKVVDAPKGMTVQTPSFGANAPNFVAIVQAVLRSVAVKWNAPEWLVSGDSSNNNYASSITAESPFVKTCKRRQKYYKRRFLEVIWRAIKLRCDAGCLRAQGRAWSYREVKALVEIQAEAPTLETRNKQEEASTNQTYIQAKVKSVQTVQQELGLDSEQEAVNIKEWDEQFGQDDGQLPDPGDPGSEPQPGEDPLAQPAPAPAPEMPASPPAPEPGLAGGQGGDDSGQALRATVGGSQAIAALQRSYYNGELPRGACVANAQIVFGFTPADADQLFPATPPTPMIQQAGDGPAPGMVESITGRFYLTEYRTGLVQKVIRNKLGHKQTVWVRVQATGDGEKSQAAKKATPGAKNRVPLEAGRFLLQQLAEGADIGELGAKLAEMHMADLQALKKEWTVKAGGTKVMQAKELAKKAMEKGRATAGQPNPGSVKPDKGGSDGTGSQGTGKPDAGAGGQVAGQAGGSGPAGTDQGGDSASKPADPAAIGRIPAGLEEVNKRISRFEGFFRSKGQHHVAEWLGSLRSHVNAVGPELALASLGGSAVSPTGAGGKVQYWGVGPDEANWKNMGAWMESYLERNGIIAVTGDTSDPNLPLISALGAPDKYVAGQDFKPISAEYKNKLDEAKNLPGLEKSEDVERLLGKPVTHLTDEVTAKFDEVYGKGKWICKCYDDNAAAGYGIFFPQRVAAIKEQARGTIWDAGSALHRYGFRLARDPDTKKVVGLVHETGDTYAFGSEEYRNTIDGDARQWADRAAAAAQNEQGAMLPEGSFMAQPAFEAVGISDAERAAGKTWHEKNEGRVHLVTRTDGNVEVIPHSTWLKGGNLPVVFEDDDTKAMAEAARAAIAALPAAARAGQVYAPDIMKTPDGYRVVELNAQGDNNGSGYLHDNHFTIDAYTSHLAGRTPAHVAFIRNILTKKGKADGQ